MKLRYFIIFIVFFIINISYVYSFCSDCTGGVCDNICDIGEDLDFCNDCTNAYCGDGYCDPGKGEDSTTCLQNCPLPCTDECSTSDSPRCQNGQLQECVTNADDDPCYEWIDTPCANPDDCAIQACYDALGSTNLYCDAGVCKVQGVDGSSCTSAAQCIGGYCVRGFCSSENYYCGDGFCDSSMVVVGNPDVCENGGNDCNDTDSKIHPFAVEHCDGVDEDCDNIDDVDELSNNKPICSCNFIKDALEINEIKITKPSPDSTFSTGETVVFSASGKNID